MVIKESCILRFFFEKSSKGENRESGWIERNAACELFTKPSNFSRNEKTDIMTNVSSIINRAGIIIIIAAGMITRCGRRG